jgi:bifunctional NMN adenylyltransferase/nudix hydrolase
MTKKYKRAILIGRYEPAHNGHFRNFAHAATIADRLHILIGSSRQPRTIKNPFTADERKAMISHSLHEFNGSTVNSWLANFSFIRDYGYNDNLWIKEVQDVIRAEAPGIKDEEIVILGHEKDESSWYLRAFPNWDFVPLNGFVEHGSQPIDATKIRELYFEGHLDFIKGAVPPTVFDFLVQFTQTPEYKVLVEEYKFIKEYKSAWSVAPYAPTFFTVDSVVLQGGHILLVKRGFSPGKGLWALPGGFLNQAETARAAAIRELREETGLKVPVPVLNGSITYEKLFDKPDRSLRGRTLTQAFLFELVGGEAKLPRVKGMDDAEEAAWFPISQVPGMSEQLFEDHFSIIQTMVGRAK